MKKLAVGAENWSIDTFAPSLGSFFGITGNRLFPTPQMVRTRIAELADSQAGSRLKPTFLLFPVLQLSDPHVPFFLPNSRIFFFFSLSLPQGVGKRGQGRKEREDIIPNE